MNSTTIQHVFKLNIAHDTKHEDFRHDRYYGYTTDLTFSSISWY